MNQPPTPPEPPAPTGQAGARLRRTWDRLRGRTGLSVVLSGGSSLGAFQVGVIDVLARSGIRPDLLVGTSVGAVNAAFWAFHPVADAGERLLDFWLEVDGSMLAPDGPVPMLGRFVQGKNYLNQQSRVSTLFGRALPEGARIEDSPIPLALVATDVEAWTKAVLRTGPIRPAVLASSAVPGLYPPVAIGERQLADGGMMANCDFETAVLAGMSDVLAIDLMGHSTVPPQGLGATIENTIGSVLRQQTDLAYRLFESRARIAVLRPRLERRPGLLDFSLTRDLFEAGRRAGEDFLSRRLVGGRVRPGIVLSEGPKVAEPRLRGRAAQRLALTASGGGQR